MFKLLVGAFASACTAIGAASVLLLVLAAISTSPASAAVDINTLAVDTNTTGNTASGPNSTPHTETLGAIDECTSVTNGATFTIDIVVNAVPTYDGAIDSGTIDHTGMSGFGVDLVYDNTVLKVTGKESDFLLASGGSSGDYTPFSFTNGVPDTDGDFSVSEADLGTGYDSGAGVLERITLQAIANGHSALTINTDPGAKGNPQVIASDSSTYTIGSILNGDVFVGSACGAVTNSPTPTPVGPTPSPSPIPTPTQIGQTPSPTPIETASPTPIPTPTQIGQTPSPTPVPTATPTNTPVPTPTAVATTPAVTHTPTPTPTPTPHGSATPTPTHAAGATVTPKVLPNTGGPGTGNSSDSTMLLLLIALGATLALAAGGSVLVARNGSKK